MTDTPNTQESVNTADSGAPNPAPTLEANQPQNPSNSAPEGVNPSILATSPTANAHSIPDSANLSDFVSKLSPEQLSRVRALANAQGITAGPKRNVSGDMLIEIRVDKDLIPALEAWSEQSGLSFQAQVQEIIDYLLPGYLIGGMGTPEVKIEATTTT